MSVYQVHFHINVVVLLYSCCGNDVSDQKNRNAFFSPVKLQFSQMYTSEYWYNVPEVSYLVPGIVCGTGRKRLVQRQQHWVVGTAVTKRYSRLYIQIALGINTIIILLCCSLRVCTPPCLVHGVLCVYLQPTQSYTPEGRFESSFQKNNKRKAIIPLIIHNL